MAKYMINGDSIVNIDELKQTGLSEYEAERRLERDGKNVLKEEKQKTLLQMFIEQIINWTNLILALAIIICFALGDIGEAVIILIIIIANGIIGVIQEGKAQKALEALKEMSSLKATVIRGGKKQEIPSEYLVVGDVVSLEAGQQVPADLKLIETRDLKIDEKALTGESVSVEKDADFQVKKGKKLSISDRLDLAYMTTVVTYGRGIGIVNATGMNTQIGKIADIVSNAEEKKSPLQKSMDYLSKVLGILCVVICVIVFLMGVLQGRDIIDMLLNSVSLAVASIPEGIPTVVAIILALGMQRMAKQKAIVKTMPAVETLGAVSYVCSDKTGTLTQNKMTVVMVYANNKIVNAEDAHGGEYDILIKGMQLCNDSEVKSDGTEIGDPTETALVKLALSKGFNKKRDEEELPRINEKPFDSERKLMTTVHLLKKTKSTLSFTKGSTDELLKRCTRILENGVTREITEKDKENIANTISKMSNRALRVLGLAIREGSESDSGPKEEDLVFVGMVGMIDPERPEAKKSIKTFKQAGIKTVMITGDHKDTAFAIAKNLGITNDKNACITGAELEEMSDETLQKKATDLSVYARVSPEHKVRIVKALQANGNIVSMTGDGVNDAPSLKNADVGVAMGITGTDVAKGAADIILQDDSFTTIEKAIREGRNIDKNNNKSIIFSLSSNISEIITMFVAIMAGLAAPLRAVHILWINLLTDSLPCFALGVDTNSSYDVMKNKPKKMNETVFSDGRWKYIVIYGILISAITLCAFLYTPIKALMDMNLGITIDSIKVLLLDNNILMRSQTYAFTVLGLSELFHAIGMRDVKTSIFKFNHIDNKVMILAFAVGLVGQLAVTEIPFLTNIFGTVGLSFIEWIALLCVSAIPLLMHEFLLWSEKGHILNEQQN